MTTPFARARHKLTQVVYPCYIPSHHIRTEMHFRDLQVHIAAEDLIQEEVHLDNGLFQRGTRPQVFGGTAHHGYTVEPAPRDTEVDEIRGEQPAPLSTTRSM